MVVEHASSELSPRRRERVLVVDDYPDTAETVRALLEKLGHECRIAQSGRAALGESYAFSPTIVILDIGLPDMSGCDVARMLRARPGGDKIYTVALSGWGHQDRRREAKEAGFDQYILKPADGAKIRSVLAAAQLSSAR
jgi:DNA-binding response OmpR family regulator